MATRPAEASGRATAVWVYGVADASIEAAPLLAEAVGVDASAPIETVREGALAAIVSRVTLDEFGEEPLKANLEDLPWLEQKALAHNAVLERALAAAALVPFRFGTIFGDGDDVRRMLRDERARLEEALARLGGRVELGVKAVVDAEALAVRLRESNRHAAELESAPPGRRYLLEKRRDQETDRAAAAFRDACARDSHTTLAGLADDARVNPPQRPELSGRRGDMILNGAYLVPREREDELRSAVSELARRYGEDGVEFELTGPWPAFNFVDDDDRR